MSIDRRVPNHFVDWVVAKAEAGHPQLAPAVAAAAPESIYVQRTVYGEYLSEVVEEAMARFEVPVTLVDGEVLDITPSPGSEIYGDDVTMETTEKINDALAGRPASPCVSRINHTVVAVVKTNSTEEEARSVDTVSGGCDGEPCTIGPFRTVILATGNPAPKFLGPFQHVAGHPGLLPDPWSLKTIDKNATVAIIGARLTAADVLLHLRNDLGHTGPAVMISRTGALPHESVPGVCPPLLDPHELVPDPSVSFAEIEARLRRACADCGSWRRVVDTVRFCLADKIWVAHTIEEQRQFLTSHLRDEWETHRYRVPPGQLAAIHTAMRDAKVRHLIGTIEDVQVREGAPDRLTLHLRPTFDSAHELRARALENGDMDTDEFVLAVDLVVHCTGPDVDYRTSDVPLFSNLREAGRIKADPNGLGLRTDPCTGRAVEATKAMSRTLFVVGPPRRGTNFESVAIFDVARQAQDVVAAIVDQHRSA